MEYLYGKNANKQQGTQGPTKGKSQPAASYGRSASRAAPTGNTTFTDTTRSERKARDKRGKTGKYANPSPVLK